MGTDRSMSRRVSGAVVAVVALVTPFMVAVAPSTSGLEPDAQESAKPDAHPRLAGELAAIVEGASVVSVPLAAAATDSASAERGFVSVQIVAAEGKAELLESDLLQGDSTDVVRVGDTVLATVSVETLTSLGQDKRVNMVYTPPQRVLDVAGEGVDVMNVDHWQDNGGNGGGQRVAIIDGGFSGYSALLGSELPNSVTTKNYCSTTMGHPEVHGTAVAEIVHETAPEARLYLICIEDTADLGQAVDYAIANDIDIINHSMGWTGPGMLGDGTGIVGDIAEEATDAGILWVNSAGNSAQSHWGGNFNDTNGDDWHNFASGDQTITMTVAPGQYIVAYMRWYDGTASNNDYDLWVFPGTNPTLTTGSSTTGSSSQNVQEGSPGQYPFEALGYHNDTGSTQTVQWAINNYQGWATETPHMDIVFFGLNPNTQEPIQHAVAAGSLLDPATHPDVLTVGAHPWYDLTTAEDFSSQGPTTDGSTKPDVIAPDGVSNETYGDFYGTSASSPYVAGAAAVLWGSVYASDLTVSELKDYIIEENTTTTGLDGPFPNNVNGNGRVLLWDVPAAPFPDVGVSNPFIFDIEWLADSGITGGYPDGTFRPTANVTRQAMAAFLYRYEGSPSLPGSYPTFSDVAGSHPFYTEISWLGGSGITSGYSDGTFRPSANVSRMAMAAFLYRQQGEPAFTPPATPTFPDVATTHAFYDEIEWLASTGITGGYSDGRFRPSNNVTRQAMAAFLHRLDSLDS